MVARIDWLNDSIERMLAGKSPIAPSQWQSAERIIERDVALLEQAASLNSLRPGASDPDPRFMVQLRDRIALEANA